MQEAKQEIMLKLQIVLGVKHATMLVMKNVDSFNYVHGDDWNNHPLFFYLINENIFL